MTTPLTPASEALLDWMDGGGYFPEDDQDPDDGADARGAFICGLRAVEAAAAARERARWTVDRLAVALHAMAMKNHPPAPMLRSICQGPMHHEQMAAAIIVAVEAEP